MTETLQLPGHELAHVTPMRLDVVNVSRSDAMPDSGTFPAPRLLDQLVGAAFLPAVSRIRVQVMPGSRLLPVGLWLMGWAVALAGQHPAAWMLAAP